MLFGTTILENIKFGREGVTDAEVEAACMEANAWGFIQRLPKKLETMVGDKGAQLSGGQKQRIAIARALLKNSPVLLLDEATSSLDSQSEFEIQKGLDKLLPGRTSLIIAHRLATVRKADLILVLEKGRIVEFGNHEELLRRSGLYAHLASLQFEV